MDSRKRPNGRESKSTIVRISKTLNRPANGENGEKLPESSAAGLSNVGVPRSLRPIFKKAEAYVRRYFRNRIDKPEQGIIEISGERYILVRAASMSKEFFDMVASLYEDRGEEEARNVTVSFLYDIAYAIGKADAKRFFSKMSVSDPIAKLSAGPVHFAHTGWAFVKILPESNPTPDDNYYLIYDHPFSFEAHTWMKTGNRTNFSVCIMNAGYSSGWCAESFGIPLVAAEVECRAKGDERCRFIMAPPARIKEHIEKYSLRSTVKKVDYGSVDIPEFFRRKRLEDELNRHRDNLEELVQERTRTLTEINERLKTEILNRKKVKKALKKSETMLEAVFDQTFQFIGVLSLDGTVVKVNKTAMSLAKTAYDDVIGRPFWETQWWEGSRKEQHRLRAAVGRAAAGELVRFETAYSTHDDQPITIDFSLKPVRDNQGNPTLLIAEGRDITELKLAIEDIRNREIELKKQSTHLEEANIALKVILKQVEEKRKEDKENILTNINQLVLPYTKRLKERPMSSDQKALVSTVESNLGKISSPLVSRLSSNFLNLTPMEIRISHLVKEGLTNKEICDLLGLSLNTVSSHRFRIRTKLGLRNKGTNLRSYLLSLED
ncbi:MAG: PAS domain-containing protein [Desulfobacteraceae bacterium]|nr:PAS domain-containing protein [Desulfobacteraceae bacterium]